MSIRRFLEAVFAGGAQALFSNRPATGIVLLAGVAAVAPLHAGTALLGLAVTTTVAVVARWNPTLLREGLFGYNGALLGLVWPALFAPGRPVFWLLVPAAVVMTWLQGQMLPAFARWRLPVLGVPFLLVAWSVALVGTLGGWRRPVTSPPPVLAGPLAGWSDPGLLHLVAATTIRALPMLALVGLAAWLTSRRLLGHALLGTTVGLAVSLAAGGAEGALWTGAFLYNAAPAAAAVVAAFPRRGLLAPSLVAGVAAALWAPITMALLRLDLFPLTAPLHLALWGALLLACRHREGRVDERDVQALAGLLRRSSRIVALSGAGTSTESGIPDYRTDLAFWFDVDPDDLLYQRVLASERSRRLYWRLQRRFMRVVDRSRPGAGHRALARLEGRERLLGIVTQNVDGLHQASGCRRVLELHGSAQWVVCVACGRRLPWSQVAGRIDGTAPPCDACGGLLKTETVSFGEPLATGRLAQAVRWCEEADLLLVLGTSLLVEPARSLPGLVRARGVPIVVVNRGPSPLDGEATLVIHGDVGDVLQQAVSDLEGPRIRPMTRPDFHYLCGVVNTWWGDEVRYLLHPLYVDHFGDTALVWEDDRGLGGFLMGFVSQRDPHEAYVHLVGTAPDRRRQGIGRALYAAFFAIVRARGCVRVSAITVAHNAVSLDFHRRLGFHFRETGAVWEGHVPVVLDHAGRGVHCVVMDREIDDIPASGAGPAVHPGSAARA